MQIFRYVLKFTKSKSTNDLSTTFIFTLMEVFFIYCGIFINKIPLYMQCHYNYYYSIYIIFQIIYDKKNIINTNLKISSTYKMSELKNGINYCIKYCLRSMDHFYQ